MRKTIDGIVIACMCVALYVNLTDFPRPSQVASGTLIKLELKNEQDNK